MHKLLLFVALIFTGCTLSHTERIKAELGNKYNEQVYVEQGGETSSKNRVETFCNLIKNKKQNKITLQLAAMKEVSGNELNLVNAEIVIADKECK